jgi:hypothetical protein
MHSVNILPSSIFVQLLNKIKYYTTCRVLGIGSRNDAPFDTISVKHIPSSRFMQRKKPNVRISEHCPCDAPMEALSVGGAGM